MPAATPIRVQCPHCRSSLTTANLALLGRPVACPRCRQTFVAVAPAAARSLRLPLLAAVAGVAVALVAIAVLVGVLVLVAGRRGVGGQLASAQSNRDTGSDGGSSGARGAGGGGPKEPGGPPGQRHAFLVGVNEYEHPKLTRLRYTINDVTELAEVLRKHDYRITLLTDAEADPSLKPTRANIQAGLAALLGRCRKGDTVVVALSGHGLQFEGQKDSYFCPRDAKPFREQTATLVSLGKIYEQLDQSFAGAKVLLVDACRDDPGGGRGVDGDTAVPPPRGVAVLFSCSAGERSFETAKLGTNGHGVFFHYVLEGLRGEAVDKDGDVTFLSLAGYVKKQVPRAVPHVIGPETVQSPNLKVDLSGDEAVLVKFGPSAPEPKPAEPKPPEPKPPEPKPPESKPPEPKPPIAGAKEIRNSVGMPLALIPAGKFWMGSPAGEPGRTPDEDQHEVEITKPFYLGVFEVKQAEYERVLGKKPAFFGLGSGGPGGPEFPVEQVSWDDAVAFCEALSAKPEEKRAGRVYRLPTEAEWEYACRAGTQNRNPPPFYFGHNLSSAWANFNGSFPYGDASRNEYRRRTAGVGDYKRRGIPEHPFGLYDMHGNVWEWCQDWYDADYYRTCPPRDPCNTKDVDGLRVARGGSWADEGQLLCAANRNRFRPDTRDNRIGFRVACSADR